MFGMLQDGGLTTKSGMNSLLRGSKFPFKHSYSWFIIEEPEDCPRESDNSPSPFASNAKEANTSSTRATWKGETTYNFIFHSPTFFFDPIALFTTFIRSEVCNRMHFGLGEFRDNPRELWHSHAWRSSLCTTSGRFAH